MEGQQPPTNLPIPGDAKGSAPSSRAVNLARIPGLPEEGDRKSFIIDGTPKTTADILAECRTSCLEKRQEALMVLSETRGLNRSDLYLATSTLLALTIGTSRGDQLEAEVLITLLKNHLSVPEGLFFALQSLKVLQESNVAGTHLDSLMQSACTAIREIKVPAQPSRREMIELKHVLLKALELPSLRGITASAIREVLEESSKDNKALRQDFANNVLAFLRLNTDCSTIQGEQGAIDLKRLATTVFTTGFAPAVRTLSKTSLATPTPPAQQNSDGAKGPKQLLTSRHIRASDVIRRLMNDDTNAVAMRLSPEELHILRQVEGLAVDEFRSITQQLRTRAISDMWARTAILDIVRARHTEEITADIRTAVLGALINEARKLGRLTNQLEKEVFAVSAEIPSLPFLSQTEGGDHAALPPPLPPPLPSEAYRDN
jgi:hypothetical protein